MAKQFLGKPVPESSVPFTRRPAIGLVAAILVPLILAGTVLALLFSDFLNGVRTNPGEEPVSYGTVRTLGSVQAGSTVRLAAVSGIAAEGTACPTSDADLTDANGLNPSKIFPIVPDALRTSCKSTSWNLVIIHYFIYKALTFANWLAGALAIILTILAGLYYMAGFANEANVKKGKAILTAAYVGLAIVILARLIIYGAIQIFVADDYNPGNPPSHSTDFIQ